MNRRKSEIESPWALVVRGLWLLAENRPKEFARVAGFIGRSQQVDHPRYAREILRLAKRISDSEEDMVPLARQIGEALGRAHASEKKSRAGEAWLRRQLDGLEPGPGPESPA